jgi:hypothetical protein
MAKHDVTFLRNTGERGYQLGNFNTKVTLVDKANGPYLDQRDTRYNPDYANLPDPSTVCCGWWQSEKYFSNVSAELREELTLKSWPSQSAQDIARKMRNCDSIILSFRRGDCYETDNRLPMSYYNHAIEQMSGLKDPHLFIFSDVPITETFPIPATIVPHSTPGGIWLMSMCKHAILANSTYPWWGAWLRREEGITIAPKMWYPTGDQDIVPERWAQVQSF